MTGVWVPVYLCRGVHPLLQAPGGLVHTWIDHQDLGRDIYSVHVLVISSRTSAPVDTTQ